MDFISRQEKLSVLLHSRGLDSLVVTSLANIFYLTGFRGSAGVAVAGSSGMSLWVDPRYTVQARAEAAGAEVHEVRAGLLEAAGRWLRKHGPRRIGYDESNLSCRGYENLRRAGGKRPSWSPAAGLVERLRAVKDSCETERIRQACRLTAEVFEEVVPEVRPGIKELDLAAELDYRMKRKGGEGPAFETIVASGRRAALPHARPTAKLLEKGDLVIFDLGVILHGYAADMTRTVYLGCAPARVRKLYQSVREAQERGIATLRPGAPAGSVDQAVRTLLKRRGLDRYFTHSTGHGVGIEIHEAPRLGRGEKARLSAGAVVTVEPGIYLEGAGGIRIEDTVLVGAGGAEILTPVSKGRWILG
jgi:Xaa-Pro aminopeptidase